MPRSKSVPASAPAQAPAPKSASGKLRSAKSAPAALPAQAQAPSKLGEFMPIFHMLILQSSQNAKLYGEAILRLQNTTKQCANPAANAAASRLAFLNVADHIRAELNKLHLFILLAIGSVESDDEGEIMSLEDHLDSISEGLAEIDIYLDRFTADKKAAIIAESGLPKIRAALDEILAKAYGPRVRDYPEIDGTETAQLQKLAATVTAVQKKVGTIADKVFTGGAARAPRTRARNPKK